MRLVHEPADGEPRPLATDVDAADTYLARMRGLTFRRSIPDDYALVFHFSRPARRGLHMAFVPFPIDAVWLVDGEVTKTKRLPAWRGVGRGKADTIVELPAGATADVEVGDAVRVAYE